MLTLSGTCALLVACTYDFDKFVKASAGGGPAGGSATGGAGASASGRGGAGASAGGRAGSGSAGRGGTSSVEAGMAGQGDGGDAGAGASGGSGGSSGRGAGGTAGSAAGKGGAGGQAGTISSGGSGNPSGGAGSSSGGAGGAGGTGGAPSVDCAALGGDVWGGHCYFLIDELRWEAARDECASHGSTSHLVTITSAEEQAFVEATFFPSDDDLWIGLSLEEPADDAPSLCKLDSDLCPFLWVTGEALDYTAWAEHSASDIEPNFTGPCTRLQADDQRWADRGCEGTAIPAICESGG